MRKPWVIHPVLVTVFPILFLYTNNIQEMPARQLLVPLGISLGSALLLWGLFGLLLRDRSKAGLATTILVFLFFTYGHFYGLVQGWESRTGHGYLLPGTLLAFGYAVYFIRRARRDFFTTTRVLNIAAVVLTGINAFSVISYQLNRTEIPQPDIRGYTVRGEAASVPDIYFIILDEYAHPQTMQQYFSYDNSPFINSLEEKGFFVANDSTSGFDITVRAIASILNMEFTEETEPEDVTYQRLARSEVAANLQALGYRYIYFGHWYETGRYKIEADTYLNFYENTSQASLMPEFSALLWNTTMLRPFYNYMSGGIYEGFYREGLINTLSELKKVPDMEGPKFVFAHILFPHVPFVFGPNGERIAPSNSENIRDNQYYLGQYVYITREIEKVLDAILANSATEPIIVIQSDHGPRWLPDWQKILNAYYLPDNGKGILNSSISPVDTFRVIFDYYFNIEYEGAEESGGNG